MLGQLHVATAMCATVLAHALLAGAAIGTGEDRPLADDGTLEGRAMNGRVTIPVLPLISQGSAR